MVREKDRAGKSERENKQKEQRVLTVVDANLESEREPFIETDLAVGAVPAPRVHGHCGPRHRCVLLYRYRVGVGY